eukprot:ANDGO_05248.mRNA.1 hypothetical protein
MVQSRDIHRKKRRSTDDKQVRFAVPESESRLFSNDYETDDIVCCVSRLVLGLVVACLIYYAVSQALSINLVEIRR